MFVSNQVYFYVTILLTKCMEMEMVNIDFLKSHAQNFECIQF